MKDDKDLGWGTENSLRCQTEQRYLADGWVYLQLSFGDSYTPTHGISGIMTD